jgi:hypothetical protein
MLSCTCFSVFPETASSCLELLNKRQELLYGEDYIV